MRSWKKPTSDQIDKTVALLGHTGHHRYFFEHLENPEWIEPLRSKGFFTNPQEPKRDEHQGSTTFPLWPESRYLARMASSKPKLVLDIILKLPETENILVFEDLVDAMCAMPAELAAELVPKAKTWMKFAHILRLPEKLGDFVVHLAKGHQRKKALDLARVVFAVLPDPAETQKLGIIGPIPLFPEPKARLSIWQYEEFFKEHLSDLVIALGVQLLKFLCDLLEDAVRFKLRPEERGNPIDYSHIWRPSIEVSELIRPYGFADILVFGVRDAAEALIEDKGKNILEIIERRPYKIFKRIGLHLRRKFPKADPEDTANLLSSSEVIDDPHLNPEFRKMLNEQFNRIPSKAKQEYLNFVENGFIVKEWLDSREEATGQRPTQEDGECRKRKWQYEKLWPIQEYLDQKRLDSKWRQHFEVLKEEFGEIEYPDVPIQFATISGPSSPKSAEELRSMAIEDLVKYLNSWRPSTDDISADYEGLGRQLASVVATEPERFASQSAIFRNLDPIYVRSLISGFQEAGKQNRAFPWPPVLDLCRWVMDQPREIPGRKSWYSHLDPGWVWTRLAIARLLSTGFESDAKEIPFKLRDAVWKVLEPITYDPDPTPEYEAKYAGHGDMKMDPATISINTTRGETLHTVVRYALWVRRNIKKEADAERRLESAFEEMKEVREVLNKHLDISQEPSLAIRAVYGWWFPWLVTLDEKWVTENVLKVFPTDENLADFRNAAWETYITFCKPYAKAFNILREEYGRAVDRIGPTLTKTRQLQGPEQRLASHLMYFYSGDKIKLDEPKSLVKQLFEKAPDALRGFALHQVGEAIKNSEEKVISQIMDRLQALWEWRLEEARTSKDPKTYTEELAAFGSWFVSDRLETKWAIKQLKAVLELVGKVEPAHKVVERLAKISGEIPADAVECLRLMVEGDKERWAIHGWRDNPHIILETALKSKDAKAQKLAEDLANSLGKLGFWQFRDLLSSNGS